jgi:hypothetical protein
MLLPQANTLVFYVQMASIETTMVAIDNHVMIFALTALRPRIRQSNGGLIGLNSIPGPRADLKLHEFSGGFVLKFFLSDLHNELSSGKTMTKKWKRKLLGFGVR